MESFNSADYELRYKIINAEDYGVCQRRERLFLVGFRKDIGVKKNFFEILKTYQSNAPTIKELFSDLPKLKAGEAKDKYVKEINSSLVASEYRNIKTDVLTQHVSRPNNENHLKIYRLVSKAKGDGIKWLAFITSIPIKN